MLNPTIRRPAKQTPPIQALPVPDPKPALSMQNVPTFVVSRVALETYIKLVFQFEVDVPPGRHRVDGRFPNDAWAKQAHAVRCGKRSVNVGLMLNVLASDRYIPAGEYQIA